MKITHYLKLRHCFFINLERVLDKSSYFSFIFGINYFILSYFFSFYVNFIIFRSIFYLCFGLVFLKF